MALAQRLELRQAQGLVMTPQLQQAIKLLQMSNLELSAFVDQELEQNPLLERGEPENAHDGEEAPAAPSAESEPQALSLTESAPPADASEALNTDYDNLYADDSVPDRADVGSDHAGLTDWSQVRGGGRFDEDDVNLIEATLAQGITLHEHLSRQLMQQLSDPAERMIGLYLIDQIDETGYFTGSLEDASRLLGVAVDASEKVLRHIQRLDPTGVGARTLKECLAAQLAEKNRLDPAMQAMLDNLELLARRDVSGLMRVCGIGPEDLEDMIAEIRALTPKPGLKFGSEPVSPAVPDVFVRSNQQGGFTVELNSDTLPRVLINQRYSADVGKRADARNYVADCLNKANWLVKSLDQRAKTILKVASEIVRQQDGFFAYGVSQLRPLNLRTIADAIGMHESTISRVTANKFMATPRGLYDMKYFFTAAIASSSGGESHSAESVRHQIKDLIDREGPADILSDDRIVDILRKAGIDIARRTVAKYRESLRIPSSVERRRVKAALPRTVFKSGAGASA